MDNRGEYNDNQDIREKSTLFIDGLTNLPNRYFLFNLFPRFVAEVKTQGIGLCIFMLDIDNFKHINDTYGHLRGDGVLKEVAEILRECVRSNDTVIRYAGDEFVVLSRIEEEAQIRHISNRITEKVSKNIFKGKPGEPDLNLTISGGFAIYPRDSENLEDLLNNADKALYYSKERGKNRFSDFNEVTVGALSYKEALKALSFPRFINRLTQMNRLKETWKSVLSNWVFFALVEGAVGSGKTRLLDEFQNYLSFQGVATLKTICSQQHILEPYYALSKVIEEYLEKIPGEFDFRSFLSGKELRAMAELIPQLKVFAQEESLSETAIALEPQELRLSLFKGLRNILVHLSRQKGLLLYFDNIHWLDKATFELLNYFFTTETRHMIMFAGTLCKEDAVSEDLPCRDFLSEPKDTSISLDLNPLSFEETREFITGIFPNMNISEDFLQSVYQIAKGNCLFTQEILKCLVEDGKILYKDNQWSLLESEYLDIPSSLEEVIQRRLRKIDPEIKEVLAQAAVMGGSFQLEVLRQTIKKDQGYLFELIDRAREKGVFSPQKKIDEVNFMSDFIRKTIYNGIEKDKKADLHHKTAEVLNDFNKDNIRQVIGDLIYHSEGMGDESKATEHKDSLLKASLSLFDPQEVAAYLEVVSKEIISEEAAGSTGIKIKHIETEVSEEILTKVLSLIRSVFAALRNISLYPEMNKMREKVIRRVYEQVKDMLTGATSLTFAELERILLVNSKRIPHKHERELVIESFIELMVERDIKAMQFMIGVEEAEIDVLLGILAQEPDDLRRKGGIAQALAEKKINHIKIETVDYERLAAGRMAATFKAKERLTRTMLLDFLLDKTGDGNTDTKGLVNKLKTAPLDLAKDLEKAAKSISAKSGFDVTDTQLQAKFIAEGIQEIATRLLPGGWRANKETLAKLISSLGKPLQSSFFSLAGGSADKKMETIQEMVANFSDEEIVDVICSGYTQEDKDSLLYMKDLANKLIGFRPGRRERIMPLLKDKLKSLGFKEAEVSFVTQKEYKDLSFTEKKDMLFKLPAQLYPSIGKDNIKGLIEELVSTGNKGNLEEIIAHLLVELGKSEARTKEVIYQILADFIGRVPSSSSKFDEIILGVFLILDRKIEEEESVVYHLLLHDIEIAVNWLASSFSTPLWQERGLMHKRLNCLKTLIFSLYKRLETKEETEDTRRQKDLIEKCISILAQSGLIEALVQRLKDPSLYSLVIEEVILKFGSSSAERLLAQAVKNTDFSFEGYIYQKKISNILESMGSPAVEKIKNFVFMENQPEKLKLLLEVIASINNVELVEAIQPLMKHKDSQVRKEVVVALSHFADPRSMKFLSEMCKDSDAQVAHLAKLELGLLKKHPGAANSGALK